MYAVLACGVGTALLDCLFFSIAYERALHPLQLTLAFNAVAFVVLIPFLYHAGGRRVGDRGMPVPLFAPLVLMIVVGSALVLSLRTVLPGVLFLATAAVLGTVTWKRLPPAFELAASRPRRAGPGMVAVLFGWTDRVPGLRSFLRFDRAVRVDDWKSQPVLLAVLGLSAGVAVLAFVRSSLAGVVIVVLVQVIWFARSVAGEARVAALPITRGRVFLHATLPGIAAGLALTVLFGRLVLDLGWQQLFGRKESALFLLLTALTWSVWLALVSVGRATPPTTRRAWRLRHVRSPRIIAAVVWLASLLMAERLLRPADGAESASLLSELAARLPFGTASLWTVSVGVAVFLFLLLRNDYFRTEQVSPQGRIETC
jgi:hypothetical protein